MAVAVVPESPCPTCGQKRRGRLTNFVCPDGHPIPAWTGDPIIGDWIYMHYWADYSAWEAEVHPHGFPDSPSAKTRAEQDACPNCHPVRIEWRWTDRYDEWRRAVTKVKP